VASGGSRAVKVVFRRRCIVRHRDARRRFSNVVSIAIPGFSCAKYGVFGGVAALGVGFCYFVSIGVPWIFPTNGVLLRLLDARQRFPIGQYCRPISLLEALLAWYGVLCQRRDAWRRFASVVSCGFRRLMYIIYEVVSPRRNDRRRDAMRRFASVLSYAFTKLIYAIYGIICRHLDARCRFVSVVSYGV
jgi:hypothetical protein